MPQDRFYDVVAAELDSGGRKPGLYLKALDEANGDQSKALALYTRFRISELEKAEADADAEAHKQAITREREFHVAEEKYRLCSQNPLEQSLEACCALSFVFGVLCIFFPFWIIAIPLGIVGLVRVDYSTGKLKGIGYAWTGIILSVLFGITWPAVMRALRN